MTHVMAFGGAGHDTALTGQRSSRRLSRRLSFSPSRVSSPGLVCRFAGERSSALQYIELVGEDDEDRLDLPECTVTLLNVTIGSGLLSIPYAFRIGRGAAPALIIVAVLICGLTGVLIGHVLRLVSRLPVSKMTPRLARDFGFLGRVSFGPPGQKVVNTVTSLEIWIALITTIVMSGVNLEVVLGTGRQWNIVGSVVLTFLLLLIPPRVYAYVSMLSMLSLCGALVALLVELMRRAEWVWPDWSALPADGLDVARAMGIFVFGFAGHPCFPSVHAAMLNENQWGSAVMLSCAASSLLSCGLGVLAFTVLGSATAPLITQNVPHKDAFSLLVVALFFLKMQLTMPLMIRPILVSAGVLPDAKLWPRAAASALLVAALVSILCADCAAVLASLGGCLLVTFTSILFPCAVFLRLRHLDERRAGGSVLVCCVVLSMIFGASFSILGTTAAMIDLAPVFRKPFEFPGK